MPVDALRRQATRQRWAREFLGEDWRERYPAPDFHPGDCPTCPRQFDTAQGASTHHLAAHNRPLIRHGTAAGYRSHRRHGQEACQDCLDAWADYQARRG